MPEEGVHQDIISCRAGAVALAKDVKRQLGPGEGSKPDDFRESPAKLEPNAVCYEEQAVAAYRQGGIGAGAFAHICSIDTSVRSVSVDASVHSASVHPASIRASVH